MLTDQQQILKERAIKLQKPPLQKINGESKMTGLEFLLANEKYFMPSEFIKKVILINDLTPLPCTPDFVMGIINFQGNILSVIDLKKILGLPEYGITNLNRLIVVSNKDLEFGLLADEICGMISIDPGQLQKNLSASLESVGEFILGLSPNGQIVLNMKAFLESDKIIVNE